MTPAQCADAFQRRLDLRDVEGRDSPPAVVLPAPEFLALLVYARDNALAHGHLPMMSRRFGLQWGDVEVFREPGTRAPEAEHWTLEETPCNSS